MYNLEIQKVIEEIKKRKSKTVLIQLPDGLKPKAQEIVDKIEQETEAEALVWFSTCFGACDVPLGVDVDLVIQWGHNVFHKEAW